MRRTLLVSLLLLLPFIMVLSNKNAKALTIGDETSATLDATITSNGNYGLSKTAKATSATINPEKFDLTSGGDPSTVITWNGATKVTSITTPDGEGDYVFTEGTEYEVVDIDGTTATLNFLEGEPGGGKGTTEIPYTINFDAGSPATFTLLFEGGDDYFIVTFNVTDEVSGDPVEGQVVVYDIDDFANYPDPFGNYFLMAGKYTYKFEHYDYLPYEGSFEVIDKNLAIDVKVKLGVFYNVIFEVADEKDTPIVGATISFDGENLTTDIDGKAFISRVTEGTYPYTVTKAGFHDETGEIIVDGADITEAITLTLITSNVTFTVADAEATPIEGATITFSEGEHTTDVDGTVTITDVINGKYTYTVTMTDYHNKTDEIIVDGADITEAITLISSSVEIVTLTAGVYPVGSGLVNGKATYSNATVPKDSEITLTATPSAGYKFTNWTNADDAEVSDKSVYTFTITENTVLTANFLPPASATINPAAGSIEETDLKDLSTTITWNDATKVTSITTNWQGGVDTPLKEDEYKVEDIDGATAMLTIFFSKLFGSIYIPETTDIPYTINFDIGNPAIYTLTHIVAETFSVGFNVTDQTTNPIEGASVNFIGMVLVTDADGKATLDFGLADGNYPYTVSKTGYADATGEVVVNGENIIKSITLTPKTYSVTLTVGDGTKVIEGAKVTFNGTDKTTNADGIAVYTDLIDGSYDYTVTKEGYVDATGKSTVKGKDVAETITLSTTTGIDTGILSNLKAYPNPFSSEISITNADKVKRVIITNIVGQRVMDITLNGNGIINTSKLTNGVYLVAFEGINGERIVRKMIKK